MPPIAPEAKAALEDARRTQILEAAVRVFARRGFEGATITDIAKAARLAEGSLYNYFRSKEELLIHIPQQLVRPVLSVQLGQGAVPDDLAEVERILNSVARAIVERMRVNAKFLKVFLSALPHLSAPAREKYMQLFPLRGADILEQFLRDGMHRGLFRRDLNPTLAARALPGMMMFFVLTQEVLLGRPVTPYGYDEIVPEMVAVFVRGVASRRDGRGRRSERIRAGSA
jgi:AcrR family transcriptional regulator